MGNVVFQQILHLVGKGYEVNLNKANTFPGRQVLRIELRSGPHHQVQFVDMKDAAQLKVYDSAQANAEYAISRALTKAEYELEYYIEKENNNVNDC
jgi:hypothetical protein